MDENNGTGDSLRDLTPEQWQQVIRAVEPHYRWAFRMCEHCCRLNLPQNDPLFHFCGALLRACIELRRVAEAALGEASMPVVEGSRSMHVWVLPHAGGGVVPK